MKQFISHSQADGYFQVEDQIVPVTVWSIPSVVAFQEQNRYSAQCICERIELPGLTKVMGSILYHTRTTCFEMRFGTVINAGYSIVIRYLDGEGNARSKTSDGNALFFALPNQLCARDYTVWFPNPIEIKTLGCNAEVNFIAVLCA